MKKYTLKEAYEEFEKARHYLEEGAGDACSSSEGANNVACEEAGFLKSMEGFLKVIFDLVVNKETK